MKNINNMPQLKALFHFFDWLAFTFWGVTIINSITFTQEIPIAFEQVEGTPFQYVYMIFGLIYFAVMAWNKFQDGKLKREREKLENRKLEEEIESMEIDNEKKS